MISEVSFNPHRAVSTLCSCETSANVSRERALKSAKDLERRTSSSTETEGNHQSPLHTSRTQKVSPLKLIHHLPSHSFPIRMEHAGQGEDKDKARVVGRQPGLAPWQVPRLVLSTSGAEVGAEALAFFSPWWKLSHRPSVPALRDQSGCAQLHF